MVTKLMSLITILVSFAAFFLSFYTLMIQIMGKYYSDIGEQGRNLFYKLPIQDSFRLKYDIYSHMCWNIEESRLHYNWFKHNSRLFQSEFQKFVISDLNDIDVYEGSVEDLNAVYAKMEHDFPSNERLSRDHLEILMAKGQYHLLIAKHRLFDVMIGYAFVYEPDQPKIIWLDYMAIDVTFQNAGYGTLLFNKLAEHRLNNNIGVFLEVEIPDSIDPSIKENQVKRIAFYERLSAIRLNNDYELPTPSGSQPMHLFFRPSPGVHQLPKDIIQETIASTFEYIHGDKIHRDQVFMNFVKSIQDESF